ncbi:MAG: hypothetical protein ACJ8FS_17245 [Sphingomicrobium sp.]
MSRQEFDPRFLNPEAAPDYGADPGAERRQSADGLREQAASCRRLAASARTRSGTTSLEALAEHFDEQARKLDPSSQRR